MILKWRKGSDCGLPIWYSVCGYYSIVREASKQFSVRVTSGSIGRLSICKEMFMASNLADAKAWANNKHDTGE